MSSHGAMPGQQDWDALIETYARNKGGNSATLFFKLQKCLTFQDSPSQEG